MIFDDIDFVLDNFPFSSLESCYEGNGNYHYGEPTEAHLNHLFRLNNNLHVRWSRTADGELAAHVWRGGDAAGGARVAAGDVGTNHKAAHERRLSNARAAQHQNAHAVRVGRSFRFLEQSGSHVLCARRLFGRLDSRWFDGLERAANTRNVHFVEIYWLYEYSSWDPFGESCCFLKD